MRKTIASDRFKNKSEKKFCILYLNIFIFRVSFKTQL